LTAGNEKRKKIVLAMTLQLVCSIIETINLQYVAVLNKTRSLLLSPKKKLIKNKVINGSPCVEDHIFLPVSRAWPASVCSELAPVRTVHPGNLARHSRQSVRKGRHLNN
jgi:hypothetical protein